MQIQEKDYYHGAALTQITEDPSFTALNKADAKYGHYIINNNIRLLVKHTKNNVSPWYFTLQPDDLLTISTDAQLGFRTFLCLTCGLHTICILSSNQLAQAADLTSNKALRISVSCAKSGFSMKVKGPIGEIKGKIPHTAFPSVLFDE